MKPFQSIALASALAAVSLGCSEKTQQETTEALEATGEAATAAAEDAKANLKKAGAVVEAGVEGAKEKADELRSSTPAEAEEPRP